MRPSRKELVVIAWAALAVQLAMALSVAIFSLLNDYHPYFVDLELSVLWVVAALVWLGSFIALLQGNVTIAKATSVAGLVFSISDIVRQINSSGLESFTFNRTSEFALVSVLATITLVSLRDSDAEQLRTVATTQALVTAVSVMVVMWGISAIGASQANDETLRYLGNGNYSFMAMADWIELGAQALAIVFLFKIPQLAVAVGIIFFLRIFDVLTALSAESPLVQVIQNSLYVAIGALLLILLGRIGSAICSVKETNQTND